jgi:preprotein translocase subunit SecA
MFKFIKTLFDEEQKKLKQYQLLVDQINEFEPAMQAKSDTDLAMQTDKFKEIIQGYREQLTLVLIRNLQPTVKQFS